MANISSDGWFNYYKGFAYANRPLKDIHAKIYNKTVIDKMIAEQRLGKVLMAHMGTREVELATPCVPRS